MMYTDESRSNIASFVAGFQLPHHHIEGQCCRIPHFSLVLDEKDTLQSEFLVALTEYNTTGVNLPVRNKN